jgi:hypothetical protein
MTKVRGVTGGGIAGNKVAETHAPKREPIAHHIDPNRPSMIGAATHFVKPPLYQSSVASTPVGATPSVAGVGGGRVVLERGTQAPCREAKPLPKGRPTF